MIQAHELRLGNKIFRDGSVITVGWGTLRALSEGANVGEPIPLTEEILLKCHFCFQEKGFDDLSVSYEFFAKKICICIGDYYKYVEYLHQLQNLYFALTGEELKINL